MVRVGGAAAYLGGAAAYLVGGGGKMNPRIRLTSAKVEVGVEVEAELGNILAITDQIFIKLF